MPMIGEGHKDQTENQRASSTISSLRSPLPISPLCRRILLPRSCRGSASYQWATFDSSNFARRDFSDNADEVLWADALMPHIGGKNPVKKPAGKHNEDLLSTFFPGLHPCPSRPCAAAIFFRATVHGTGLFLIRWRILAVSRSTTFTRLVLS